MAKLKLTWFGAPKYTTYGDHMATAYLTIDKDHTLTLCCEQEMIEKVNKMLENVKEYGQTGTT